MPTTTLLTVITLSHAGALALACVLLIAVPGPSVMFVVGRALSRGRPAALASVIGNAIGCYLVGLAVALGLGPLLERSELLFQVIKWAGILYLLWLGVTTFRSARPVPATQGDGAGEADGSTTRTTETPWAAARTGVIVGATNPKALILFTALVPQFVDPAAGGATRQILLLGIVPILIGLMTDTTWALAAGKARTWLGSSPRRMAAIGRAGGLAIIGVGASVAVSGTRP